MSLMIFRAHWKIRAGKFRNQYRSTWDSKPELVPVPVSDIVPVQVSVQPVTQSRCCDRYYSLWQDRSVPFFIHESCPLWSMQWRRVWIHTGTHTVQMNLLDIKEKHHEQDVQRKMRRQNKHQEEKAAKWDVNTKNTRDVSYLPWVVQPYLRHSIITINRKKVKLQHNNIQSTKWKARTRAYPSKILCLSIQLNAAEIKAVRTTN